MYEKFGVVVLFRLCALMSGFSTVIALGVSLVSRSRRDVTYTNVAGDDEIII